MFKFRKNIIFSIYRYGHWVFYIKNPIIRFIFNIPYKFLFFTVSKMLFNAEIYPKAKIGKNLQLPHHGNGVIIDDATIGDNVIIRPQVIIGKTFKGGSKCATIGNNVDIGVGAKILGNISIGDNVKIGALAVVIKDVPSNVTVVGIPAEIVSRSKSSAV
ncbi:serine acetyltransferase [Peribacillus sp. NJ4]|uniref:serine O-acetyltransferase n=1 Tax=Peribacillus sp. NJ4 TaxID=3055862 RepID=UPI0025A01984|nr:serine acetyltransferase [Peribacillus sp. NJ4]MDM5211563.1 serine acetyltransferase [Peribacillus sp. NJ4]